MVDNVFASDAKEITLDDYLGFETKERENLGSELPVVVYRMLEYSLKEELRERYGKEAQIAAFRGAGKRAGEYFARYFLDTSLPFDRFVGDLQAKMQAEKIGILRIEEADEASGRLVLTVSEDADCSGLPVLGETVCNYDEGFISGVLSLYSGKPYTVVEVDCWSTGDRVCRFHAEVKEQP